MCFPSAARSPCLLTTSYYDAPQKSICTSDLSSPDSTPSLSSFDCHSETRECGNLFASPYPSARGHEMYQWLDAKSQLSAMEPASPTRVVREAECVNFTAQAGHCTPRPALVADRRDFSCAEALCPSCSWRIAELACDPVWIDDARSRIRGAALAVVEAQQASAELSARVAEASSAEILSAGECQDAFGRSSGSFSTKDNQASKGRNSATFGRWWSRETCNDDVTENLDGAYLTDSCRSNSIDAPFADLSRNSSRRSFQRAATTGSANLQNVEVPISPRFIRRTKTSSPPTEAGDAPLREKRGGLVDMVRHAFMRSPSTS